MEGFPQKILPPEILTEIFGWIYLIAVATSQTQARLSDGKGVRQLCWPVSQVSKYWREVTLAAPFLWTYLPTINLDANESPFASQQLERLKALIPRTQNHLLHISVVGSLEIDLDESSKVVDYITGYCERWGTLSVQAEPNYLEDHMPGIRGCLPRLEMLKLDFLDGHGQAGYGAELTLFADTPNLKFVHITGDPTGPVYLDTRALVHMYDDTAIIMHNLRPTCNDFPELTSLEVLDKGDRIGYDYSELSPDEDVFVFSALKTLHYSISDSEAFPGGDPGFLKYLEAPALEELSVVAYEGDVENWIMDLGTRSGPLPLRRLYLRMSLYALDEETFPSLLQLFPELESLNTNLPRVSDITSLSLSQGDDVLVPRLREYTIGLNWLTLDDDEQRAISVLAEARCSRPQPSDLMVDTPEHSPVDKESMDVYMQLCIRQDLLSKDPPRITTSLEHLRRAHLVEVYPIKLESWYHTRSLGSERYDSDSDNGQETDNGRRSSQIQSRNQETTAMKSLYAKLVSEVVGLMLPADQEIDSKFWAKYERTLELITESEKTYKSEHLVGFLAENTSPSLVYLAYLFRNHLPDHEHSDGDNRPYNQVLRILKKVKADLLQRLAEFHWIWEISPDAYTIRYIHDGHEIRADPDKFANAILGLSSDLWIQEDLWHGN